MKTELKEISEIGREVAVEISIEEIDEEFDIVYEKIARKTHWKGFRPGKVPRNLVVESYQKEAESDVLNNLVSKTYGPALDASGMKPITKPEVTVTHFTPGEEMRYTIVFDVKPVIDVKGLSDLVLTRPSSEVTEEEIQERLRDIQDKMAQLEPLSTPRKANSGDIVLIDYTGFREGQPLPGFEAKDFRIELGKKSVLEELETAILEMMPEEKKRISLTLPEEFANKTLAGQVIELDVALKEIKTKKLPELNDDFAKDLGEFESLEDVKTKIREDIGQNKQQNAHHQLRRQVIEKLAQANSFPVPEGMIQNELEDMLHYFEQNLLQQGFDPKHSDFNKEEFFSKNRDEATLRVKGGLIFDAVSQKQNISVTSEEIQQRAEAIFRVSGPPDWKKTDPAMLAARIEGLIREEKTLDFVLSQSTINQ